MHRTASLFFSSLACLAIANRSAAELPAAKAPSFTNEVIPLLTRLGCNQGACHGKAAGQNGFRLSLRGYAPEWDHEWLTREFAGRRINATVPEASLLLQKPLGQVAHSGGTLLRPHSREHRLLLDWIRGGAPGPGKTDLNLRRLEVLPDRSTLKPGEARKLVARGLFSDGSSRDVTWLTQFASNDAGVATVSPEGAVQVMRPGETSVRAAFLGQVAVAIITSPHEQPVPQELFAPPNNIIDDHVFKKLAQLRIPPAALCTDEVFIRRVFLDLIGVLPTPAEVRNFLADKRPQKRVRLIDLLLERPEFVDFWALELGDLLQNRKESDHDVRGTKGVRAFHEWLRRQVKNNRPWDELARELLTVRGANTEYPPVGYFIVTVGEQREADRSDVVAAAAQTFLGTRIGCAKCHNHPLEKYTQDDYYHFAGFFARIRLERKDPKQGPTKLSVSAPDPNQNKNPIGVVQPRTGQFLKPQPLDRSPTALKPGDDPRLALAAWMTAPANEYFSGAMVNRLWAHFFAVGLVEPVDDLRTSNPPTNPALWQALVREFVSHKFDRKHLMRLIVNSRAYQLASEARPGNERDSRFYSHFYPRRLPAEVFLDAVSQATGVPERFDGYPAGIRAVQVPDPAVKSHFLATFGRSERITACTCERNSDVTLPQLLHLQGGSTIGGKIRSPEGRLAVLLRSGKADPVEELFLLALARLPRPGEMRLIRNTLERGRSEHVNREEIFRDLFWALLNTKEFAFNH